MQIQKQEFSHCQHIKVDGTRCGLPSLQQKMFCYFHNRVRKLHIAPLVPILEDANAVQFALSEVLQALQEEQIEPKKAAAMGYILQIAAYNLRNAVNFQPYGPHVVLDDPAEAYFQEAMKKLPENASSEQVHKIMNTAAKG